MVWILWDSRGPFELGAVSTHDGGEVELDAPAGPAASARHATVQEAVKLATGTGV